VINVRIPSGSEYKKDRKTILREERLKEEKKKRKEGKTSGYEKDRKIITTVKIGLERIDMQKEITIEALLNSRSMRLAMSLEFANKTKV